MAAACTGLSHVVAPQTSPQLPSTTCPTRDRVVVSQQSDSCCRQSQRVQRISSISGLRCRNPLQAALHAANLHVKARGRHSLAGGRLLSVRADLPAITEAEFESEVLESDTPVLVDFWAPWCGPCKLILPIMEGIAKEYQGKIKVVKVEADPNPTLVKKYKVYGLPMLVMFENGEVVFQNEGAISKAKVKAMIEEKLPAIVAN